MRREESLSQTYWVLHQSVVTNCQRQEETPEGTASGLGSDAKAMHRLGDDISDDPFEGYEDLVATDLAEWHADFNKGRCRVNDADTAIMICAPVLPPDCGVPHCGLGRSSMSSHSTSTSLQGSGISSRDSWTSSPDTSSCSRASQSSRLYNPFANSCSKIPTANDGTANGTWSPFQPTTAKLHGLDSCRAEHGPAEVGDSSQHSWGSALSPVQNDRWLCAQKQRLGVNAIEKK